MNNSTITNHITVSFDAFSVNEAFARTTVAIFMSELNPTLDQIDDVKTAVSEAVTNAIIHGYEVADDDKRTYCIDDKVSDNTVGCKNQIKNKYPQVVLNCSYEGRELTVEVIDKGVGISDIKQALEPLYTSKPQLERSGMGFSFMAAFMDELSVSSVPGHGTRVIMKKKL